MWTFTNEEIKDLLPQISSLIDVPNHKDAYEWMEKLDEQVLRAGWERINEGAFAFVYEHPECYGFLLKIYNWDHHQRETKFDADIIERIGDDPRCMKCVARHPLAVVVTEMYGDELKVFMDDEDPWRDVVLDFDDINRQIAAYIRFCISRGVVPYDLSPRNIFYSDGELGFIDYGLYELLEDFLTREPNADPFEYAFRHAMQELGEDVPEDMFV